MKIVTVKQKLASASANIRSRSKRNCPKPFMGRDRWDQMADEIDEIENLTVDDVCKITGQTHWTDVICDFCGSKVDGAAEFETSEWPILICHDCLISAANELIMEITQ